VRMEVDDLSQQLSMHMSIRDADAGEAGTHQQAPEACSPCVLQLHGKSTWHASCTVLFCSQSVSPQPCSTPGIPCCVIVGDVLFADIVEAPPVWFQCTVHVKGLKPSSGH
jgi:hypothetical protein